MAVYVDGRRIRTRQRICGVFNGLPENTTLCYVASNHRVDAGSEPQDRIAFGGSPSKPCKPLGAEGDVHGGRGPMPLRGSENLPSLIHNPPPSLMTLPPSLSTYFVKTRTL